MTWPTERPGYPMHAERDGWHWLKHPEDLRPFPSVWNAELRGWPSGGVHSPQGVVDLGFDYLGPCYTQADLDAAVQAEREACIDVLNGHAEYDLQMCCDGRECGCLGTTVHQSIEHYIRARGPTSALDAALAQARREGARDAREQIAKVFEDNDMLSTASEIRALPISASERIRDPIEHDLKCQPPFFEAVRCGDKPFEVRKDDRDYRVGDTLILREWRLDWKDYTGRMVRKRVTYKLAGGAFGVEAGTVVLGLSR